jgi:uncharacterized membrane protein
MRKVQEKNLALAIGLNLFLPGIGYMYMGKIFVGLFALLLINGIFIVSGALSTVGATWLTMNIIMAIDMIILHGKNKKAFIKENMLHCPQCAELIQKEAKVCRFCGASLQSV